MAGCHEWRVSRELSRQLLLATWPMTGSRPLCSPTPARWSHSSSSRNSISIQKAERSDTVGYVLGSNIFETVRGKPVDSWDLHLGTATFVLNDKATLQFGARTWIYHCNPSDLARVKDAIIRILDHVT